MILLTAEDNCCTETVVAESVECAETVVAESVECVETVVACRAQHRCVAPRLLQFGIVWRAVHVTRQTAAQSRYCWPVS